MKCARCGNETRVIDTVDITTANNYSVRRRRRCMNCKHQFHTSEILYHGPNNHTLTMEQVSVIRKLKTQFPELSQTAIAKKFGVTQATISRIVNKARWPIMNGKEKSD
jgi:transcriptional regulator NrdR family protein